MYKQGCIPTMEYSWIACRLHIVHRRTVGALQTDVHMCTQMKEHRV